MMPPLVTLGLGLVGVVVFHHYLNSRKRGIPLPPGPPRLPLIGNYQKIERADDEPRWITYQHLAEDYGDIVYTEKLGKVTVVLNTHEVATDLLEKRSNNYSDRPPMPMANDFAKLDWDIGHMRYSDKWRIHRRAFHQFYQLRETPKYHSIEKSEATMLLRRLIASPENYHNHIKHYVVATVLRLMYGYNLQTPAEDDPFLALAKKAMVALSETVNQGFLVDFLPIMRYMPAWFPGAGFKRKAKGWATAVMNVKDIPWEWVKMSLADGTADVPSFVSQNVEKFSLNLGEETPMEEVVKNCAGIAYFAGSDTSASSTLTFILSMIMNPEIQARAQKEIEAVTGGTRLPDFGDRDKLPLVEAIMLETLRCHPPVPLAVPHATVRDDVYRGFFIPAGSTIISNLWTILHNEKDYPDPMKFDPDRFLKQDPCPNPIQYAFGFGRRICVVRYFAIDALWIAIATLLATFDMRKGLDKDGNEIEPVVKYRNRIISGPEPFQCRLIPRSDKVLEMIEEYDK